MSDGASTPVPEDVTTPKALKNKIILFTDALISEVKKRPLLWDKNHKDYGCRSKVSHSWHVIAATLKRRVDEIKSKWRNLKDSFHRLEKRIEFPPEAEGSPLESYYTGQWIHFEKLLFLRDTRNGRNSSEDFIEADVPDIFIKEELDMSEHSNDSNDHHTERKNNDTDNIFTEPVITLENVLNRASIVPNCDPKSSDSRKRSLDPDVDEPKRRMVEIALPEAVIDEDLHFVKSLVPFMRKLNPIRKLIVRNEMQNLLIKEMLCENCRSFGPQPNCKCDIS